MSAVLHPRVPPRRSTVRATTWWGKAWVRAVEEAAYAEADLVAARTLARAGRVGQISTEPGRFVAAVEDPHGIWTVEGSLPVLDHRDVDALVEAVAAESGRVAALLDGDERRRGERSDLGVWSAQVIDIIGHMALPPKLLPPTFTRPILGGYFACNFKSLGVDAPHKSRKPRHNR